MRTDCPLLMFLARLNLLSRPTNSPQSLYLLELAHLMHFFSVWSAGADNRQHSVRGSVPGFFFQAWDHAGASPPDPRPQRPLPDLPWDREGNGHLPAKQSHRRNSSGRWPGVRRKTRYAKSHSNETCRRARINPFLAPLSREGQEMVRFLLLLLLEACYFSKFLPNWRQFLNVYQEFFGHS